MVIMMKLNGLLKFLIFKSDICKFSDSIDFGINQKFFLIYKRKIRLYYVYEEKIFYICPYFYQNEHNFYKVHLLYKQLLLLNNQ